MRQQEIFKKIGVILSELIEQYEYLNEEDNNLNSLEIELLLANSNFLTNHFEIFYKLNMHNAKLLNSKNDFENEQKFFEPLVQHVIYEEDDITESIEKELIIDEFENDEIAHNLEDKNNDSEEIVEENDQDKIPELSIEELAKEEYVTQNPEIENISETHSIINSENIEPTESELEKGFLDDYLYNGNFSNATSNKEHEPLTVNQKISSQLPELSTDQTLGSPLKELKHGITLNDKLLYVKDLFNGYNLAYSEAIEILNRFSNFEEATRFLNTNYVAKNNWMSKPDTVEKFYAVLKRRYF